MTLVHPSLDAKPLTRERFNAVFFSVSEREPRFLCIARGALRDKAINLARHKAVANYCRTWGYV